MKKINSKIAKFSLSILISVAFFLLVNFIVSLLANGEIISLDIATILTYFSVTLSCFISFTLIRPKDRLLMWAILNISVWCTFLWTVGVIIFKVPIDTAKMIFIILSSAVGSFAGMILLGFLGGKR